MPIYIADFPARNSGKDYTTLRIITAPTFKNLNAFDHPGLLNLVLNLVCALLVSLVCVLNLVCALNGMYSTGTAVCVQLCTGSCIHTHTHLFRTFESMNRMKICILSTGYPCTGSHIHFVDTLAPYSGVHHAIIATRPSS